MSVSWWESESSVLGKADSFLGSGEVHLKTTSSSEPAFSFRIGGGDGAQRFGVHRFNEIWEINKGS